MSTLTGTSSLIKLALRRDRGMLPAWIYVLTALVAGTAYGFEKLYPTPAGRAEFAATAGHNPALIALYGPLYGNSLGSLTAWRYGAFAALGAGLMSIFIVVRHTRADEEAGRLELLGSAAVGRNAALAAALLVALGCNLVLGALITAGLTALGVPALGSLALGSAIAGCGVVFTAGAAVAAQFAGTARAARGLAIGAAGVAYLLRAVGDSASARGSHWLTWLSPIGWEELIRAFGAIRWWLLILPLTAGALLAIVAGVLVAHRDHGSGLLPQRPGPAAGAASLNSPFALAWRLHRGALTGWLCGALIYGLIIGSAATGISGLLDSSQIRHILAELGGTTALTNAYLAAIMSFDGLIAAGYGVSVVLRLRAEETSEHADVVLTTGTSRFGWGMSHLVIAAGGSTLILVAAGLGAGLGYALRTPGGGGGVGGGGGGGGGEIVRLLGAGLVQVPAALVIAGLAAALFGLVPRASVVGGWSALGVAVLMLFLGATLQLSHWVLDVSPFTHLPKVPGQAVPALPLVLLGLIAVALALAGLAGLRRRDIG